MRAARPFIWRFMLGLLRPKRRILGLEFAGVVEEVGSAVTQFAVGDRVFGLRNGSHAEYVCVRESGPARTDAGGHDLRGGGRVSATA